MVNALILLLGLSLPLNAEQSVTLAWDPSDSVTEVAGYKIYYGVASGNYTNSVDVGNVLIGTVSGLAEGMTYFFAVTAYNISGWESDASAEISYTIPARALAAITNLRIADTNRFTGTLTAELSGAVNPNGLATVVMVQYGLSAGYVDAGHMALAAGLTNQTITLSVPGLVSGATYNFRLMVTNSAGVSYSPAQALTLPSLFLLGDANGDGVVDQAELNTMRSNFWPSNTWLCITNAAGLGGTNIQFTLTNFSAWNFTVLMSTDAVTWIELPGFASPSFQFSDPGVTNQSQRFYRLRWP